MSRQQTAGKNSGGGGGKKGSAQAQGDLKAAGGRFFGRGTANNVNSTVKLKDGLIMIRGFKEDGSVADDTSNSFRMVKSNIETYTQMHYPKLIAQIEKPFDPEFFVKEPKELKTKDADLEGVESKVKLMLVTQIVKDYLKDVRDLANEKIMLAADLFSICPRLLQERINLKAKESLDAKKTAIDNEEYDREDEKGSDLDDPLIEAKIKKMAADREPELVEHAESHSRHSAYWLWKTIILIMELGESSNQRPTEIRSNAKNSIESLKMMTTESVTDYEQRFLGAYLRYEEIVKSHGDGNFSAADCADFKYESEVDRTTRFIKTLDKSRYLKFVTDYHNNIRTNGIFQTVRDVVTEAISFRIIKTHSNGNQATNVGGERIQEVAVFAANIVSKKKQSGGAKKNAGAANSEVNSKATPNAPVPTATVKESAKGTAYAESRAEYLKSVTCYRCGQIGHLVKDCPQPEARINNAFNSANATEFDEHFGFCGMLKLGPPSKQSLERIDSMTLAGMMSEAGIGDRDILFDTGCEVRGMALPGGTFLTNLRFSEVPIRIKGIDAGAAPITCNVIGTHCHFGDIYICDMASANVLSGVKLIEEHVVTWSQAGATVTVADGTAYLFRKRGMLLACNLDHDVTPPVTSIAQVLTVGTSTVRQRERQFSMREIIGAKRALELKLNSGLLSNKDLSKIPWRGMGIVPKDVARAEYIYGRDFETAVGRTTQRDHARVAEYVPVVLPPYVNQQGHTDLFMCGPKWFILLILLPLDYWHVQPVDCQTADHLAIVLLSIVYDAKSRGFQIPTMAVDPQSSLLKCKVVLATVGCVMEPVPAGAHVVVAERSTRTIEERVRGAMCGDVIFPYNVDVLLLTYAVLWLVQCRNCVPSTHSPAIAPRAAYLGRMIDASVELRTRCGQYCHVTETVPSAGYNSVFRPRVVDCIALMSTGSLSGSWKFLSLRTGKVIVRNRFTVQPMTDVVIAQMNARAAVSTPIISRVPRFKFRRRLPEVQGPETARAEEPVVSQPKLDTRRVPVSRRNAVDREPLVVYDGAPRGPTRVLVPEAVLADESGDVAEAVVSGPTDVGSPAAADESPSAAQDAADEDDVAGGAAVAASNDDDDQDADVGVPGVVDGMVLPLPADVPAAREVPEDYSYRPFRRMTRSATKIDAHGLAVSMCLNLSLQSARKRRGQDADVAADAEILQIVQRGTVRGRMYDSLTALEIKNALPIHLFMKEKFLDNIYERLKGRAVVLGNFQDRSLYEADEMSAPTVSLLALLVVVVIALKFRMKTMGFDVTGAFLYAKVKKAIIVRFPPHLAKILMRVAPEFVVFKCADGSVYCDLDGALYGTVEAARLWFEHVTATLTRLGFAPLQMEPCVFQRGAGCEWVIVTLYVDDGKAFCQSENVLKQLGKDVSAAYTATFDINPRAQYLGMMFDFTVFGECRVGMPKLIADVLLQLNVRGGSKHPHDSMLYVVSDDSPALDAKGGKLFYSVVYKLYYCSIRTEYRIQVAVNFLTSRVTKSTEEDWAKLMKVLKFLNCTKRSEFLLKPDDGPMQSEWYIDVGHAIHMDMRSQTGSVGKLNGATIYVRTTKQKSPTKSSAEAEQKGVSDEAGVPLWVNEFLRCLGLVPECVVIREDNTATIMLLNNGRSNSARTRHMKIREFWLKHHIDMGELKLVWVSGDEQLADALSKPVVGGLFIRHFDAIHGVALEYLLEYPR